MYRFGKGRRPRAAGYAAPARLENLESRRLMCNIGDRVWLDADCDGLQDAGEAGVAGVTVTLYDGSGNVVNSMVTDANGGYLFTRTASGGSLDLGTFSVKFDIPAGFHASPRDQGADNAVDSDIDAAGSTGPFVIGNAKDRKSVV